MSGAVWLVPWHPRPWERPTLLCLPPAGAACGRFRPWQAELGPDVSAVGVQLPGRERRWAEPPAETVDQVVEAIADEVRGLAPVHLPVVVFGHSFGGLLGYEIARRLEAEARWPVALVVAACRPPHHWVAAGRALLEDEGDLVRLMPGAAGELDEDSRELALDLLRQDARLSLTYRDPGGAVIASPVEAWSGTHDEVVTRGQMDGWAAYAAGDFRRRDLTGGHHFCMERPRAVVPLLRALVRRVETRP